MPWLPVAFAQPAFRRTGTIVWRSRTRFGAFSVKGRSSGSMLAQAYSVEEVHGLLELILGAAHVEAAMLVAGRERGVGRTEVELGDVGGPSAA